LWTTAADRVLRLLCLRTSAVSRLSFGIAEGSLGFWFTASWHGCHRYVTLFSGEAVLVSAFAALRGRPRRLCGVTADADGGWISSGNQVGVLAQPVAGTFDLHHHGVVKQAIEQRGGDNGTAENLAPLCEAAIERQNHRAVLIAR
jgi:hypothetical protein